jgi:hypothetical protein
MSLIRRFLAYFLFVGFFFFVGWLVSSHSDKSLHGFLMLLVGWTFVASMMVGAEQIFLWMETKAKKP